MIYFVILFSILYFVLAWRRLDWAVILLIAALPSYLIRFSILGIPSTVLEVMILIAFFVWLIRQTNFLNFIKGQYTVKDYLQNRKKRAPYPFGWELALLIFIAWVSAIVSGFSNQALGIWKAYFFEPALLFIVVLNVFKPDTNNNAIPQPPLSRGHLGGIEKFLWPLAVSAFTVSVLAIYQKITGNLIDNQMWAAATTRRSVSFFGYPNAVGLYLGPIVMVLIGWLFHIITNNQETIIKQKSSPKSQTQISNKIQNPKPKFFGYWNFKTLLAVITILLSLLSIYFAKSEGALIGIVTALFAFGLLVGGKLKWITIIVTIIIGGSLLAYQPTRYFVEDKIKLHDFSGQVRRQQWKETRKMLTSSPTRFIFGTGLANYQTVIKPFHQEGIFVRDYRDPNWHRQTVFSDAFRKKVWQPLEIYLYPHNILLNFWTELGLAGTLLFVWIIGKLLYIGFKNLKLPSSRAQVEGKIKNSGNIDFKYLNRGLISAFIVIIVHGVVDVPYFKNDLAVMFWLLIALVSLLKFISNQQNQSYGH